MLLCAVTLVQRGDQDMLSAGRSGVVAVGQPPRILTAAYVRLRDGHYGREAIHRVVTKIPAGHHPGDNLWRCGNMLGAIDLATGQITRVVQALVSRR
jgi:hypothetical protein